MNILKKVSIVTLLIFIISCNSDDDNPTNTNSNTSINKDEAQKAYNYLNKIRANPSSFSNEIGDDLSYVASKHNLVWNSILASVAEEKAKDMAERNYFSHVNPEGYGINYFINKSGYTLNSAFLKSNNQNNFESLAAGNVVIVGSLGEGFIKQLILDQGYEPDSQKGHRIHLLGIDPFWANCFDIGIGIAKNPNSKYENYCCVIIAKHNF